MKEIELENLIIYLSCESGDVRVKTDSENVILSNQSVDSVAELIKHNFNFVLNHYKLMINGAIDKFDFDDINFVSVIIILHYLYMYNTWRSMYKNQENRDLRFIEKDFVHSSTHDLIFNYFKVKFPNNWEEKCAILLGMGIEELRSYYKTRENFYYK